MFLPKSKYSKGFAKPGEFILNGRDYIGPYFETYLGEYYAGETPDVEQGQIFPAAERENTFVRSFASTKREPTKEEYESGSMVRYFRQDNRNGKYTELSLEDSEKEYPSYYTVVEIPWILKGPLDDVPVGNYKYKGTRNRNQESLDLLESQMYGIVTSLNLTPEEFVVEG